MVRYITCMHWDELFRPSSGFVTYGEMHFLSITSTIVPALLAFQYAIAAPLTEAEVVRSLLHHALTTVLIQVYCVVDQHDVGCS